MTESQTMRYRRRAARAAQERKRALETALCVATLLFLLVAFAFAGTCDYEDEQASLAYWESQGITVVRDF